jgi:hypothetical protein
MVHWFFSAASLPRLVTESQEEPWRRGKPMIFSGTRTILSSNRCGVINHRVFLRALPSGSPAPP